MVKICYVVTIPLTIEAFFLPQLHYLSENGFDVTVVCSNSSELQKKLGESIHFHPIEIPRGVSLWKSIRAIIKLTNFFKKENFDLIQYSTPNAAFYSSIASKVIKCKVRNYHLMGFRYLGSSGMGKFILKSIEKITCYNSTSIECVSKSNLELGIKEKLFTKKKASIVWNGSSGGVDLSRFDFSRRKQWRKEIREKLNYSENDFVYGFVGRITKDKGVNELLSAFLEMNNNSKLLLIGTIENNNGLDVQLLEKSKMNSNIKFHDFVSDVEQYYSAIDVLVLPSYREGFGNVIIEAEAMGVPVIVSNIPGPTDAMINNVTGLICEKQDINDLKNKMEKMYDKKLCLMLGGNAKKYVSENFDQDKLFTFILENKKELIKTMLGG